MPPGSFKPTLQLRHQLTCSGIAIDAAAYDARRHHLLTYGSHALKPHTLRLFSLRREIRSTPLFDAENEPPPLPPPSTKTSKPKVPSVKEPGDPIASTVLRFISLFYALELDVFVCVYSAYLPSHPSTGALTGYTVVVLEPASLKKLVVYSGPRTHLLRCACLDEPTGRLVLASRVAGQDHLSIHRKRSSAVRVATTLPTNGEDDRSNVVEMIEISKRPFRHPTSVASTSRGSSATSVDRVMLCVERLPRATLWHSDPLDCIAASPRVCTLFGAGAAYDDDGDEGDDPSVVLEWRENAEGTLTLARRIFHEHDRVTTLATTRSGQWLFTGHVNGVLKVWAMAPTACSKDDDHPPTFAPAVGGEGASFSHQSAVATIEFSACESKDGDAMETAMLYTTEQASGRTRHWRFRASAYSTEASTPQLDCLGHLDVDPMRTEVPIKKKKKRARGGALGDWTRTIALCIAVQMGSYTENLLVVTRGDMIHVIKIQTLVQVIHDVARGDKIFGVESLPRRDGSVAILCFSGTTSFHQLQISGIDPQSAKLSAPHEFCLPPPMQVPNRDSIRLTRLHVGSSATSGESWIVCGWSTGVVEVYTEQQFTPRRIALLQDPRLDVEITSLAIVNCQGVAREKAKAEDGVPSRPAHSWGGLLKSVPVTIRGDHDPSVCSLVVAGTARGAIFGWCFPDSTLNYTAASVLILDASIAVDRQLAHSAHVVDLIALSSESKHLLSMGADGILKLWALPAMQLQQHINAAASSGATGTRLGMLCSCVQVLNGGDSIAVGYEDGAIGVWQTQGSCASSAIGDFVELHVSGRHGRHVSAIVTAGENKFLTASLDMTIVLWAIAPNKTQVDELRFFELGEPILDCCAMGGIVLVGLSDEVCWFAFDEDTKKRTQSCSPSPQEILSQAEVNAIHDVEADTGAVADEAHPEDSSPGSPTPRTSTGQTSLSEREDSVNSSSIPSVVVPRSATIRRDSLALHFRSSRSGRLEGWQTDQTNDSPMDAEVLALYVRQYVTSCGVAGTIVAESLSHFLSVYHLPWCKRTRPDFFIRKYLFECKIDPKTRLTADETTALLLDLQRTAEPAREDEMPEKTTKPSSGKRRAALKRLAESRKKANRVQNKSMNDKVAVVTYNILGEKSIKWVPCSQSTSNQEAGRDVIPLNGDAVSVDGGHCHQRRRGRRKEPSPRTVMAPLGYHLPNGDLLGRVHLSSSFQPMWTRGFCWCLDSQCIVQWDKSAEKNKNSPDVICSKCGHQRHTLHLQRKSYKPHFTARTILGIIAEVYEMMIESAHEVLYRNGDTAVSSSQEFSIHAALWKLFQHRFGVQKLVETKLKLLFVSMCHLVREMDAIAVFGELLALFQRAEHDEQVPHKLVALCVVTHGWLYAREMVVNGDPIWGNTEASNGVNASSKATHWQFVSLSNALFCAQETLVYPVVSPGYLQNILLYMEDYAQHSPTKPGQETVEEEERDAGTRWIDIHRLLRLLVGEWKQQMTEFRGVERLLFSDPVLATQDSAPQDNSLGLAAVLEKLRLILSCFVFYDNERVGLTELSDFENILRRLKYLWPNEHLSEEEAAGANRFQDSLTFENTIIAARRRFGDTQGDGRICYLDFWAMLYIAGVRTKSLLKFREIPSFCKDYRLEVSSDLREMLSVFMQRSSALLLPRGFQTANNSVNESTRHEHQRRVGGLYDGVYIVDTNATPTLSMQQLLRDEPYSATDGLYIDGAIPAMHQSASTTALDGFSRGKVNGSSGSRPREPVVVGIRPIGPHPKSIGVLSVSSLGLAEASDTTSGEATRRKKEPAAVESREEVYHAAASPLIGPPDSYANVYIRFPNVAPRKTDVDFASAQHSRVRSLAGSTCGDSDDEAMTWQHHFLEEHEHDEQERRIAHEERLRRLTLQKEHAAMLTATQHTHNLHASPPKKPSPTKPDTVVPMKYSPQGETCRRVDATTEAARPALTKLDEPVVVVPTVEAHPETNTLPGGSPTVPKRRRPQADTESEPVVGDVMIQPKEMAPVVIQVNSPQVGPRDVNSDAVITEELKEATLGDPSLLVSTPDDAHAMLWPRFDRSTTSGIQISTPAEEDPAIEGGEEGHEDQDEDNLSEEDVSDAGCNSEDELGSDSNDEQEEDDDDSNISVAEASPKVEVNQTAQVVAHEDVTLTSTSAVSEEMNIAQLSSLVETPTRGEQTPTLETVIVVAECNTRSQQAVSAKKPLARKPSVVQRDVPIGQPGMVATQSASKQTTSSSASPGKAVSPSPTFAILSSPPRPKSKPTTAELRHRFRFSQQPKFKLSAALISNPFRMKQWKPLDGSDSNDESELSPGNGLDEDDDTIDVDDMALRLSRRSLVVLRKEFGRKTSVARTAALAAAAFSRGGLSRRGRRGSYETNENFISEEDSSHHHGTSNPVRLNEDVERALYGDRARRYLGEGIAFSADAEAHMLHKWQDFFGTAEATMFSPLKEAIKQREEAQRQQDELQSRLMKKRMEQQHLDTMRLRRNTTILAADAGGRQPSDVKHDTAGNFRARRLTRESCLQAHQRLILGETASGELHATHATSYFHFEYAPDAITGGYSIITFKLHVVQGEADLFLSTQTTAPCSSDFMWRSAETCVVPTTNTAVAVSDGEGQKIVLFPHDVARLCGRDTVTSVVFYMAVVALAPHTSFTLGVMTTGQKAAPSRAIQTVDNLIAHFNQLAKTYEGQASRRRNLATDLPTTNTIVRASSSSGVSSADRLRAFLASAASMDSVEGDDEEGGGSEKDTNGRRRSSQQLRRQSTVGKSSDLNSFVADSGSLGFVRNDGEHEDTSHPSDGSSFQRLLESFGQKHRLGLPHSQSLVLGDAMSEQREFLHDEEVSYRDTKARLASPLKNRTFAPGTADTNATLSERSLGEDDGTTMAVAVVTERRLSTSSSLALQQRLGARLKERLSPLKASRKHGESASLRVARSEPKLVAYSLSSLPPPKHALHQLQLGAVAPVSRHKNKR